MLARQVASGANGIQLWFVGNPGSRWNATVASDLPIKNAETYFALPSVTLEEGKKRASIDLSAPHGVAGVVLDIAPGATATLASPNAIHVAKNRKPKYDRVTFQVGDDVVVPLGPEGTVLPASTTGLYLFEVDRVKTNRAKPSAEHTKALKALGYID